MVNIATLIKRSNLLRDEHRALIGRLEQLRNDQRHNNYIPAELFRFIEDLRTEVASLRSMVSELMEEKRLRMEEEEKKAKMEEEKKAKMEEEKKAKMEEAEKKKAKMEEKKKAKMDVFQFDRF